VSDDPSQRTTDTFIEIVDGATVWRFEPEFLTSNWRCLFGSGCKGILSAPSEELNQGCCSLGAHFGDGEAGQAEARQVSAYVGMLTPEQWQFHDVGTTDYAAPVSQSDDAIHPNALDPNALDVSTIEEDPGVVAGFFGDRQRTHTRVVEGACVFLNRPGFAGGEGCALHIAAVEYGDSPTEWKPSVCWQLPLRVDWTPVDPSDPDGPESATVRRWARADWGKHGTTMAWCCTEHTDGGEAYSGDEPVVDSLADELRALAGEAVYVQLRKKLTS
jgi:hypothetical protein